MGLGIALSLAGGSTALAAVEANPSPERIRPELLQANAQALGITVPVLKTQMKAKTLYQIAKDKGMSKSAFRKKVASQLQAMINNGTIKGAMAKYYSKTIQWSNTSANKD